MVSSEVNIVLHPGHMSGPKKGSLTGNYVVHEQTISMSLIQARSFNNVLPYRSWGPGSLGIPRSEA
jgi:hypothetical protein